MKVNKLDIFLIFINTVCSIVASVDIKIFEGVLILAKGQHGLLQSLACLWVILDLPVLLLSGFAVRILKITNHPTFLSLFLVLGAIQWYLIGKIIIKLGSLKKSA